MATTLTAQKIALTLKLDNGTSESGAVKTVSVSVASLDKDGWDDDKAFTLATLIGQCLSKNLYAIQKTETSNMTEAQ